MSVPELLRNRRSVRAFLDEVVSREVLDELITAASLAPAPHHSRPWRFVVIDTDEAKRTLAVAMARRWERDLEADGMDAHRISELTNASRARLEAAPALIVGCTTHDGLDHYPDERRQAAEEGMALLSLGAAVQNLMLAATEAGLASCWVAAPIFCPDEARRSLALADSWLPQALVMIGHPDPTYTPRDRGEIDLGRIRSRR